MTAVFFDQPVTDANRRKALYDGNLFVYSPTPTGTTICNYLRCSDLARLPEDVMRSCDDGKTGQAQGALVFTPDMVSQR